MQPEGQARPASEVLSMVLLGIATVASAWCAYQAQLWSGEQVRNMALADVRQSESIRKTTVATRNELVDVAVFVSVVEAQARHDERAAAFLKSRARPEFRPAL